MKSKNPDTRITSYTGQKIEKLIPKLAELRIEVFAEYPFLYQGKMEYEISYLKNFATLKDAIVVAAFDKERIVGIATGCPFIYEDEHLKKPFLSSDRNPKDYYCFREAMLKKPYRGLGIGKKFLHLREEFVRKLNKYKYICFYTSLRPDNDPRRPEDYRSLDSFWEEEGFVKHPELIGTISYPEFGEEKETPKKMVFWIKNL